MKNTALALLTPLLLAAAPAPAPDTPAAAPAEIVAAAPETDWTAISAADLLVMDLAPDAPGHTRRVVIQLMPAPFSQGWIGNIRKLAAAHWWDGTSVNRVQDNYVVQWGDAEADNKAKARVLLPDLNTPTENEYVTPRLTSAGVHAGLGGTERLLSVPIRKDSYADAAGFWDGWPVGRTDPGYEVWPIHCYGMVGVGRNMPPDTGSGAELYVVIGTPPRHLDRNIALVGRVIEGIGHLSSLPRGTGDLSFYKTAAERTAITAIRLGNEVPGLPTYEYLSTESASFASYADARANRRDAFFIQPAGGADICNIPVPVRRAK